MPVSCHENTVNNFSSVKEWIPFCALRTCPVAAENAHDKLLLKNDFLNFFQGTVATFYRCNGQKPKHLCQNSLGFHVPKIV